MSLKTYDDLIQGAPEWHDARRGMVTASVVGSIITPSTKKPAENMHSRALAALIACERINQWTDDTYVSDDMWRGHVEEPHIINAYTRYRPGAAVTVAGFMARDDWGFSIGYSPDGLVDDDGCIEAKSRAPKKHMQTIYADAVPTESVAQCQAALLVSGREWCDYVSFSGGMRLYVKRVHPDPDWQEAIVAAVERFEEVVEDFTRTYYDRVGSMPETERVIEQEITF